MNSKVFYRLTERMMVLEEQIKPLNNKIIELQETSKKSKKGSEERKSLQLEAKSIKDSVVYQALKAKIDTMYYCRTIACYTYGVIR